MIRGQRGDRLPVVVIGAGPIGLAAAAHLLDRGEEPLVLESGSTAGAGVASWGHVRLFTPWRQNVDPVARDLLEQTGWRAPDPDGYPTGHELVDRYLRPLAALLDERLLIEARVVRVARSSHHGFDVALRTSGGITRLPARAVIDASGTMGTPNPIGAGGVPAPGEIELFDRIRYGLPDVLGLERQRFAGRRVLVVGSGHSAQNALVDLVELRRQQPGTRISWAVRGKIVHRLFGRGAADPVAERGRRGEIVRNLVDDASVMLRVGAQIVGFHEGPSGVGAETSDGDIGPFDAIIAATGFRPDLRLLGDLRLDLDPALECPRRLAPLIDPAVHWCGSVLPHGVDVLAHPEPDLYLAGMKSYGRSTSFLMATGYEQVRSIAAALAGDRQPISGPTRSAPPGPVSCGPVPRCSC